MKIMLVGTGGFAVHYVKILLDLQRENIVWEGIVDPFYAVCPYKKQIDERSIPVYDTMEQFYACHRADLTIICTPTFLHCRQSICALANGSHVLCEKPVAPTVEEARQMLAAEKRYGRFIAIGYQWSYCDAIRNLKSDILKGVFGKPVSLKTAISWPRNRAYYQRGGGWGGRIQKDGQLILDSIASNACAHYLHNMLFLLGDTMEHSTAFKSIQAECYRANAIENFDTCCIRLESQAGAQLYFAASHAAGKNRDPIFEYTFERGVMRFEQGAKTGIVARFHDGSSKDYGDPFQNQFRKLWDCIEAVQNSTTPICTVETALPHVQLIETLYHVVPVLDFPRERISLDEETDTVFVEGLYEQLYDAYEARCMLSESAYKK